MDIARQIGMSPEEGVIVAVRDGDPVATAEFVRNNIEWMLAVARRLLRDNALSEDAVQNAFINVFRALKTFEGRSSLKTWMHRIVVNEALATLRKGRRLKETSIEDLQPDFDGSGCRIDERWERVETPEALLQKSQIQARVLELIERLPDHYRVIVVLRDIEELSTHEVAEVLDLSETNVKVRLHRARSA